MEVTQIRIQNTQGLVCGLYSSLFVCQVPAELKTADNLISIMSSNCRCIFHWKLFIFILLSVWHLPSTSGQGYFPNLVDLAVLKPINSSSTCGATSTKYCQSSTRASSLQICDNRTCKFDCCSSCGDSKPVAKDLAGFSSKQGVTQDGDPRNGSSVSSFRFQGNSYILPLRVPAINYVNPGFTVSVWIKQKAGNKG